MPIYEKAVGSRIPRIDGLKKDAESLSLKLRSELAELFFMTENDMGESGNLNMPLNPVELLLKVSDQKIMQEYDERGKGIYLTLDLAKSSNGTFISGFVGNESRSIKEDDIDIAMYSFATKYVCTKMLYKEMQHSAYYEKHTSMQC